MQALWRELSRLDRIARPVHANCLRLSFVPATVTPMLHLARSAESVDVAAILLTFDNSEPTFTMSVQRLMLFNDVDGVLGLLRFGTPEGHR